MNTLWKDASDGRWSQASALAISVPRAMAPDACAMDKLPANCHSAYRPNMTESSRVHDRIAPTQVAGHDASTRVAAAVPPAANAASSHGNHCMS